MSNGHNTHERNLQIVEAYLAGEAIMGLAIRFGVSRQRINQIVRAGGCPHRKPEMAEKRKAVERAMRLG